ncbi:hypothetical protein [Methylomonas sp. AM2-LC]|uniref:hypothetical protein n=1 Tax=Methylomonas sp. AM2-LC TaxID=3153301 RepID=UPI00326584D8
MKPRKFFEITGFLCIEVFLWITTLISFEAGFYYHSTKPSSASQTLAYFQFLVVGKIVPTGATWPHFVSLCPI